VDVFSLDTNGCDPTVQSKYADANAALARYTRALDGSLGATSGDWKVIAPVKNSTRTNARAHVCVCVYVCVCVCARAFFISCVFVLWQPIIFWAGHAHSLCMGRLCTWCLCFEAILVQQAASTYLRTRSLAGSLWAPPHVRRRRARSRGARFAS
jgi:hypothetical protein